MNPAVDDFSLLIAEREAILRPLERLLRGKGIAWAQLGRRVIYICLSVGAEMWRKEHPALDVEQAARVFGEMAAEAVRAYNDARTIILTR